MPTKPGRDLPASDGHILVTATLFTFQRASHACPSRPHRRGDRKDRDYTHRRTFVKHAIPNFAGFQSAGFAGKLPAVAPEILYAAPLTVARPRLSVHNPQRPPAFAATAVSARAVSSPTYIAACLATYYTFIGMAGQAFDVKFLSPAVAG